MVPLRPQIPRVGESHGWQSLTEGFMPTWTFSVLRILDYDLMLSLEKRYARGSMLIENGNDILSSFLWSVQCNLRADRIMLQFISRESFSSIDLVDSVP